LGANPTVSNLISLEGNPALAEIARKQVQQLGLHHTEIINGDFDSTLSTALGKLGSVDLAFIDGNHQKEPTLRYYEQILPYTHNDTVLIFDDIYWSPEMQEAWQEIIARPEVTLSLDFYRMGMVFFRKEIRQPQHIRLYYW
jgi:predicted O-methyltransferase YrrM